MGKMYSDFRIHIVLFSNSSSSSFSAVKKFLFFGVTAISVSAGRPSTTAPLSGCCDAAPSCWQSHLVSGLVRRPGAPSGANRGVDLHRRSVEEWVFPPPARSAVLEPASFPLRRLASRPFSRSWTSMRRRHGCSAFRLIPPTFVPM